MNSVQDIDEVLVRLGVALLIGTIIGGEREIKNKAAGLRTLILISLGSALFTMLSGAIGAVNETGRIASNIVTGIGFLGAGAIMREGLTVSGLTTASSIWVTAALGMAVGAGEYYVALFGTAVVLAVLTVFGFLQSFIERYQKAIELHITLNSSQAMDVEKEMKRFHLKFRRTRALKKDGRSVLYYDIGGRRQNLTEFLDNLNVNEAVESFEY
jgi:putative Mg2+ transporter-C (MgtC) family protein